MMICEDTRTLGRPRWLALRREGIGSSDAAGCMGRSPYASPYSVWAEKSGHLPEMPDSSFFAWRRRLETPILDWWEEQAGVTGERHTMHQVGIRLANPDLLCKGLLVEAKTAHGMDERRWDNGPPDHYVIQVQHQMYVCEIYHAEIVVSFGGQEPRIFKVDWDSQLIRTICMAENAVWEAVASGVAPDPDGSEATMLALRAMWETGKPSEHVELSASGRDLVAEWGMAAKRRGQAQKVIDGCKAGLMAEMGEATEATIDGEIAVTWRNGVRGRSMRLREES